MNVTFDLSIIQGNVLQISDTTQEYYEYLEEDNDNYLSLGSFKYSDTVTINVIKYKSYNSEFPEILGTTVTKHKEGDDIMYLDEAHYPLTQDGYYIIDHMVIPTLRWLQSHLNEEIISQYTGIYVIDDYNNIYKKVENELKHCSIEELVAIENPDITTVSKASQETFSICFINTCYLEQCKKQLENAMKDRCAKSNHKTDFNTDLLWIAINAIKYNIEFGYLNQAQLILEEVTRCTNLCNTVKGTNYGCQCGR